MPEWYGFPLEIWPLLKKNFLKNILAHSSLKSKAFVVSEHLLYGDPWERNLV